MPDQFEIDIQKWIKKVSDNVDNFMLEFTQDLAEEVVTNTPVDTGFLRASWTANTNSPDLSSIGAETNGNEGAATTASLSRITANLIGVQGGDIVYYTNNAEYGAHVEFGTSRQAGQGFVRDAVAKAETLANNAAKRVNK